MKCSGLFSLLVACGALAHASSVISFIGDLRINRNVFVGLAENNRMNSTRRLRLKLYENQRIRSCIRELIFALPPISQ